VPSTAATRRPAHAWSALANRAASSRSRCVEGTAVAGISGTLPPVVGATGGIGRWLVTGGICLAAAAVLLLALAGPGTRAGWWHYRTGLGLLRYVVFAAAGGMLLALVGGALRGGWRGAALAVVLALVALSVPLGFLRRGKAAPRIHDISTDLEDPPRFQALLAARAGAENPPDHPGAEVAEQQRRGYADIQPIRLAEPPVQAHARALAAAKELGWELVAAEPAEGRIEATATTAWYGFKDDVVIRIRPDGTGSRVDVRSKSRVGKSDVGANAARIRAFCERLGGDAPATSP
jgi:uncharacterized protein (DUF1499 family)